MLTNILKTLGIVGVAGAGIGGGVAYATSTSNETKGSYWKKELSDIGPILSCQEDNGLTKYELLLNIGGGGHLQERFDPKVYRVAGENRELVEDFFYFWLWYNKQGQFEKVSIQTISDLTSSRGGYGKETKCQDARIEVNRKNYEWKENIGQVYIGVNKNTCVPKEGGNQKTCNLEFLSGGYFKWKSNYQPKVTYTWVSS